MFQTYEPVSDRSFAARHLPALRARLVEMGLDGFLVPHDDEYQNEYIPAYAERLMWISGFSGSAGAAIVLSDRAVIFTDGRYTIQVRDEVDENFFEFASLPEQGPAEWLKANAKAGMKIGYDPMLHTRRGLSAIEASIDGTGARLVAVARNPVDEAWTDQPSKPTAKVFVHDDRLAGKSSVDKRSDVADAVAAKGADAVLITAPPSIAWAFNIRGGDVARTPLPLGRALLHKDGSADLFIDPEKISDGVKDALGNSVRLRPEEAVEDALAELGRSGAPIGVDPALTPVGFVNALADAGATLVEFADPCELPRATKTNAEIDGARAAHIRDGVAVARFLHWLDANAPGAGVDEIAAASRLEEIRRESGELTDISFDSISGAGPNGALCHYRVSTETNRPLADGELYLIDSGGQYRDGTTDITRTIPIGQPTEEMCDRFTRVLKGHIALATAKFPVGTTGHQLDAIARRPLWDAGLDYDHGTGHGVGSFLSVHEGPQRIAKAPNGQKLHPGMILSNEPGFYKAGAFGIRIENLIVVASPEMIEGVGAPDRPMMSFETITLAPIDRRLIEPTLLSENERNWLNAYHKRVRDTLSPQAPAEIQAWLDAATQPI